MTISAIKRGFVLASGPPIINSFTGGGGTLYWVTTNADSIYLSGVGAVASSGSIAHPTSSHLGGSITYTLTATGSGISVSQSITTYQSATCVWIAFGWPQLC